MLEQSQKYKDGFLELTYKQTEILLNNTQVCTNNISFHDLFIFMFSPWFLFFFK